MANTVNGEAAECVKTLISGFNMLIWDTAAVTVAARRSGMNDTQFILVMYQALNSLGDFVLAHQDAPEGP